MCTFINFKMSSYSIKTLSLYFQKWNINLFIQTRVFKIFYYLISQTTFLFTSPTEGEKPQNFDQWTMLRAIAVRALLHAKAYHDTRPPFLRLYLKDPWLSPLVLGAWWRNSHYLHCFRFITVQVSKQPP